MSQTKTHFGGCHCGKVRYEVTTDLARVMSCNCSICAKKGALLTFVGEGQFRLLAGADDQTEYLFNKHRIHHLFCKACGVQSYATGAMPDGTKTWAINVRCLDDVNVSSLSLTPFDGKSL